MSRVEELEKITAEAIKKEKNIAQEKNDAYLNSDEFKNILFKFEEGAMAEAKKGHISHYIVMDNPINFGKLIYAMRNSGYEYLRNDPRNGHITFSWYKY